MSSLPDTGRTKQEQDLQTPRPVEQQWSQEESVSSSPSGRDSVSMHSQRKSFSSLSAPSVASFSSDDHSEVGELPVDPGGAGDVRVRTETQSSSNSGNMPAEKNSNTSEEDLEGMQKQLADLAVRSDLDVKSDQQASNITYQEEEDEDSYLNDPLIKYTLDLHDYTKRLYIEARIAHEKLQKERSRGGKAGRSGSQLIPSPLALGLDRFVDQLGTYSRSYGKENSSNASLLERVGWSDVDIDLQTPKLLSRLDFLYS